MEFPLEFKCPHCGKDKRITQHILDGDHQAGRIGEHIKTGVTRTQHVPITDPKKPGRPGQEVSVLGILYDLCANCGQEYIFRVTHEVNRFSLDVSKLLYKPLPDIPPEFTRGN